MARYSASLRAILACILAGVCDSLRLPSTIIFFLSSVTVRVRTCQCLVLNGVIFLGGIFIGDLVLAPTLRAVLALGGLTTEARTGESASISSISMPLASSSIPLPSGASEHAVGEWLNVFFLYAYQLLWIYPLYAISFILNAIWYQDVADHAFITHGGATERKSITFQKWVATMSDEVYRLLLVTAYTIQITLTSFLPFGIGSILVLIQLCWMYSLYSFEYKWSLLGWSLEYRLKYFEKHWAYFLGFGLPAVLLSLVFPKFISLGIFALTFPIFIILAIIAKPVGHKRMMVAKAAAAQTPATLSIDTKRGASTTKDQHAKSTATSAVSTAQEVLLPTLPIFRIATWINWWLLSKLQRRSKTAAATTRRPSIEPPVLNFKKSTLTTTPPRPAAATATQQQDRSDNIAS
jgi:etoposide-induced 2.4 mRNA